MVLEALHLNVSETRGSFLTVYFKLYASENEIEEEENEIGLHMDFYSEDLAMAADGIRNHSFTEGKKKLLLDYIFGSLSLRHRRSLRQKSPAFVPFVRTWRIK